LIQETALSRYAALHPHNGTRTSSGETEATGHGKRYQEARTQAIQWWSHGRTMGKSLAWLSNCISGASLGTRPFAPHLQL